MGVLDYFFKRKAPPAQSPVNVFEEDDIPRYPPFAKGLPSALTSRILQTQTELIARIKGTLRFSGAEFEELVVPVIERYAAYVHLLPASESHHHRGAGGLFRHGLEVGQWAAQRAESHFFCVGDTQKNQRDNETRWQFAAFLGGLLHDVGKPLSDVAVTDKSGKKEWNPYESSLGDWLQQNSIDRYFLRWRDKRNKRHEKFSMMNLDQIIVPRAKSYLNKPGPYIMEALLESIVGTGASEALTQLVLWADQESVKRDLSNQRLEVDEYAYGVPVERFIFDALRRLVATAKINEPGAAIWRLEKGVFLSWQAIVQEIHSVLDRDKVPGVPRNPDTLADILIERGFAVPFQESPDRKPLRYWRIYPEVLKGVPLFCVRVDDIELIFTSEPPPPVKASFSPPPKNSAPAVAIRESAPSLRTNASTGVINPVPTNENCVTQPPVDLYSWDEIDAEAAAQDELGRQADLDMEDSLAERVSELKSKRSVTQSKSPNSPVLTRQQDLSAAQRSPSLPVAVDVSPVNRSKPRTPAWDVIYTAVGKSREGVPTLEVLPDGSYGIPYPASAQLLGIPRDVMHMLSDEGMLRLEQISSSKTHSISGKKYLVLNREISKFIKNAMQVETQISDASVNSAVAAGKPAVPEKGSSQSVPNHFKKPRSVLRGESQPEPGFTSDNKGSAPVASQESIAVEFVQQIIQGFGHYIVGDVDTKITETNTIFRVSIECAHRIASVHNLRPSNVMAMLRAVPGMKIETNKEVDYIELIQ